MSSRKRKHDASPTAGDLNDRLLHIQAYEAEVRRGPTMARSLEASGLQTGEALIKHPTGETEIWLDRCVRSIPTLRNRNLVCAMRPVTDIHLTFAFGLLCALLLRLSSCCLGGLLLTSSPSDMMCVSSWIRYPLSKGQESGDRHPHLGGPTSRRIRSTRSFFVTQKPRSSAEISVDASWKAPARKGCGR